MSPRFPDEVNASLQAYHELHITARDHAVDVIVGFPATKTVYAPCPILRVELGGRLAGGTATVVSRGGKIGESPGDDVADNDCGVPQLRFEAPPPEGPALLEIFDPTVVLSCSLPDLEATRELAAVAPEAWSWQLGQEVTLRWSPSGDLARWRSVTVALVRPAGAGSPETVITVVDPTFDGDLVHFKVPAALPVATGAFMIRATVDPRVVCAPGDVPAYLRTTLTTFAATHPVTITP